MSLIRKFPRGDTMQITWVDSGVTTADSADYSIYSGSETIVNTGTLASSGNGHYYANFTIPSSYDYGFYVSETLVTVGGFPYKRRMNFKVMPLDGD